MSFAEREVEIQAKFDQRYDFDPAKVRKEWILGQPFVDAGSFSDLYARHRRLVQLTKESMAVLLGAVDADREIEKLRTRIAALEKVVQAADRMREDYYRHDGTDVDGQPVQSIREYDDARKEIDGISRKDAAERGARNGEREEDK